MSQPFRAPILTGPWGPQGLGGALRRLEGGSLVQSEELSAQGA